MNGIATSSTNGYPAELHCLDDEQASTAERPSPSPSWARAQARPRTVTELELAMAITALRLCGPQRPSASCTTLSSSSARARAFCTGKQIQEQTKRILRDWDMLMLCTIGWCVQGPPPRESAREAACPRGRPRPPYRLQRGAGQQDQRDAGRDYAVGKCRQEHFTPSLSSTLLLDGIPIHTTLTRAVPIHHPSVRNCSPPVCETDPDAPWKPGKWVHRIRCSRG